MFFAAVATVFLFGSSDPAWAHPHVWVDAIAELMLNDNHRLQEIRVYWAFDEIYTGDALEHLGVDGDEKVTPDRLTPLATEILNKIEKYLYFTYLKVDGKLVKPQAPQGETAYYLNHRLVMYFLIPVSSPVDTRTDKVSFAMYDPTYYTAINFVGVRLNGSLPAGCATRMTEAASDPGDVVPPSESFFQHLDPSTGYGAQFARWVHIVCSPPSSVP